MRLPTLRLPSLPAGTADYLQRNLYAILAGVFIIAIGFGYLYFYTSLVAPTLNTRNQLASQVTDARQAAQARGILPESPDSLQTKLNNARATLVAASKVFLTDAQISDYIKRLYLYADDSHVTIIDLQTSVRAGVAPPTPTPLVTATRTITPTVPAAPAAPPAQTSQPTVLLSPTATRPPVTFTPTRAPQGAPTGAGADLFRVTTVRLQARGSSNQLVEFVSRIRETQIPGVLVTVLDLAQGEKNALLTLELVMVSAAAPETATPRPTAPAPTRPPVVATPALPPPTALLMPTPTLIFTPLPTSTAAATATFIPTLSPASTTYVVRAGDTLYSIARRYNTSVEAIMAANRLSNYNIYVGQTLIIPR
ncbi:MAG: LysM peptidoglycan-binding domain-containing protein [Chloroflexi bacterium]|nr:LysM peptidoglycan-binding domain-containing protein [Chloroflexota bacterium]